MRVLSRSSADLDSRVSVYGATAETMYYFLEEQNIVSSLFSASLLTPDTIRNGPTDTWGNIKIPASQYVADLVVGDWYVFDRANDKIEHSSLVGVPTWNIPTQGTANFSLSWPIFNTDCHWDNHVYTALEWCYVHFNTSSTISDTQTQQCIQNETSAHADEQYQERDAFMSSSFLRSTPWNESQFDDGSSPHYVDITLSVSNQHNYTHPGLKLDCVLRTIRVEAEVFCSDDDCQVSRMRKANDAKQDFINPVS